MRAATWLLRALFLTGFGIRLVGSEATPAGELRGLWVDGFHAGFRSASEVTQLVAHARTAGFNALFVEVRRRGDVFYTSSHEPRAAEVDPRVDPLRLLLDEAHSERAGPRIQVHAWIVAYNIWNHATRRPVQTNHPYVLHPEWLTRTASGKTWDGANYAFDPGHPGVQEHVFQVGMELVRRYEVDGLHLDYIRYAGPEWGYNARAVERFNRLNLREGVPAPRDAAWLQFRRDQVTALVRRLYLHIRSEKPSITLSAATIGFAPGITNSVQWPASAAYSHVLQDWRAWMEEGILDWNLPMLYFRERSEGEEFTRWARFVRGHQYRRRAAAGLAFYLNPLPATLAQRQRALAPVDDLPPLIGVCAYSYANLASDRVGPRVVEALKPVEREGEVPAGPWSSPASARVPPVPWKSDATLAHLMGYVRRGPERGAVDGAEVLLTSGDVRLCLSDACGFFGFVDVTPGIYQITVSEGGGAGRTLPVTLRGGEVTQVELELPRSPASP